VHLFELRNVFLIHPSLPGHLLATVRTGDGRQARNWRGWPPTLVSQLSTFPIFPRKWCIFRGKIDAGVPLVLNSLLRQKYRFTWIRKRSKSPQPPLQHPEANADCHSNICVLRNASPNLRLVLFVHLFELQNVFLIHPSPPGHLLTTLRTADGRQAQCWRGWPPILVFQLSICSYFTEKVMYF
jgi:hypothetical protein